LGGAKKEEEKKPESKPVPQVRKTNKQTKNKQTNK